MEPADLSTWRWTAILLLSGGLIFWIGAWTPPYKWWMTRDIKEYLSLIYNHKTAWLFIAATFAVGIIITLLGMHLFSTALQNAGQKIWPQLGYSVFAFGSIFWILNIAFRGTVTVWAANQLHDTNLLEPSFKTWMDWSNVLFAIYMVLAYFSIGCMGLALKETALLPIWVSWMCIVFGFAGSILYLCRIPLF